MKKSNRIGAIILLVCGLLLTGGGIFLLANRFLNPPLWSFNSTYVTDNFLFILLGVIAAFFGVMILLLARSMLRRDREASDTMKQHMGMKATSRISNTIIYVVLVIMLMFRPQGIFGNRIQEKA